MKNYSNTTRKLNEAAADHVNEIARDEAEKITAENRIELLKSYLKRLGDGEALESVREDFVKNFSDVDAAEIMKAEQTLIAEGTPITEVQRLCDVHSALFHGATPEERIASAEKAVQDSLIREAAELAAKPIPKVDYSNKRELAASLTAIPGHPLNTLTRENDVLSALIAEANQALTDKNPEALDQLLTSIREVAVHYAKKGDLIYPHLKSKYGIAGPSDVMWTVDDEIRDELAALTKELELDELWMERAASVLKRTDEMIFKENAILFPNCAVNFTEEDWMSIYQDSKDYPDCLKIKGYVWEAAETVYTASQKQSSSENGEIVMPGGHLTIEQLTALLNTIPLEITFVDADNINRFFNEGPKVFKRPGMAIDREVFSCHPPKIESMVRAIIDDFRHGRRDRVPVWMNKGGHTMLVTYMAVRDHNNTYLGTVELVQDMEFAKEYFTK